MNASDPVDRCHVDAPIQSDKERPPTVPEDAAVFARRLPELRQYAANSFYLRQKLNANAFRPFRRPSESARMVYFATIKPVLKAPSARSARSNSRKASPTTLPVG